LLLLFQYQIVFNFNITDDRLFCIADSRLFWSTFELFRTFKHFLIRYHTNWNLIKWSYQSFVLASSVEWSEFTKGTITFMSRISSKLSWLLRLYFLDFLKPTCALKSLLWIIIKFIVEIWGSFKVNECWTSSGFDRIWFINILCFSTKNVDWCHSILIIRLGFMVNQIDLSVCLLYVF